jgi:hypothetical protein
LRPLPPWGRGWPAAGVFISRGGPGEGVATLCPSEVNSVLTHATPVDSRFRGNDMLIDSGSVVQEACHVSLAPPRHPREAGPLPLSSTCGWSP